MQEKDLTRKQRKWLEASRKIGPLAMTKSERETLEKLYADMLPQEQQDLKKFIEETFGQQEDQEGQIPKYDPITRMETRFWATPSDGLKKAFSRFRVTSGASIAERLSPRSPEAEEHSTRNDMSALLQEYRSLGEALAARGSQKDGGKIDECVVRVERILKEWDELRLQTEKHPEAERQESLREEMQIRERDLEKVLQELKEMV